MQKIISAYIRAEQCMRDRDKFEYLCYFQDGNGEKPDEWELDFRTGSNLRRIIRDAKDSAHKAEFTHISVYFEGEHLETVRLTQSPRRKKEAAEEAELQRKQYEEWKLECSRIRRYEAVARLMRRGLTSRRISAFYRAWKSVTGYGVDVNGTLKKALQPAKQSLIEALLERARKDDWIYGANFDRNARNAYRKVIYFDTPEGQVSFHVLPDDYPNLPRYNGAWSGKADSDQILKRLYTPVKVASSGVEAAASNPSEFHREAA